MAKMKKRKNSGFSLAEVLVAILIMAMVTTVVAGSIPSAINAYRKVTKAANAQLLMSTTVNTLRGWLDQAEIEEIKNEVGSDETTQNNTTIKFHSAGIGECRISVEEDGIYIEEYMDSPKVNNTTFGKRLLVAKSSGGGDLFPVYSGATYNSGTGVLSVTGICVMDKEGNTVLGPTSFSTKTLGSH